jgi:hypothetical protein
MLALGVLALIGVVVIVILISGNKESAAPRVLPTTAPRKVIRVGGHQNKAALCEALRKGGFEITPEAQDIMSKPEFTLPEQVEEVEFVFLSLSDLGFREGATRQSIIHKAEQDYGLQRCKPADGPYYRLSYGEQPRSGECVMVAMTDITDSGNRPRFFDLCHTANGKKLEGGGFRPNHVFEPYPNFVWMFRRG